MTSVSAFTHTHIIAVGCSVATSSSESLPNDAEKPNQPMKHSFPKFDYARKMAIKSVDSVYHSAEMVFINLYWKDCCTGKSGRFCKHKPRSLYN